MKNYNPIGLIVLLFTFTLSIFIFFCESQAENLTPVYLLLLGSEDGVSDTIGPAGGYLEIQDAKDNLYRLIIPQGALTEQKLITIKPTAAGGFASLLGPLSGSLALFPQGLTFSTPAKLEIVLSKNTSIPPVPAIYLEEEAGKPGILLQVVKSGQKLTTSLEHFSTATPVGALSPQELQLFINVSMQLVSLWESNCAATSQMAKKRNFYGDSLALETLILEGLQFWGLDGDFDFEHRTSGVDFCGNLFDHEITYILILYDGTYWPPGLGNVEMEVNEQRQFDYKIACVNGFCQGDALWFIPRIPPEEPPIASVTQGGVVTGLREGESQLQVFSKEFSDIYVPDFILGQMDLKVRPGDCVYLLEIDDYGTYRYIRGCRDPDDYSKYTTLYHIINTTNGVDLVHYVDEGVSSTLWTNLDILPTNCECAVTSGWSLVHDYDQVTWQDTQEFSYHGCGHPYSYNQTLCWPEIDGDVCGPYVCPSPQSIQTHNAFPGDCRTWWGHYDDQDVWQECTY